MTLKIEPLNPDRQFAARVTGLDIARGVSEETAARIEEAIDEYAVLVFPDQRITDDQQYQFSRHFGAMETATGESMHRPIDGCRWM